jgi:hypothetical protein
MIGEVRGGLLVVTGTKRGMFELFPRSSLGAVPASPPVPLGSRGRDFNRFGALSCGGFGQLW